HGAGGDDGVDGAGEGLGDLRVVEGLRGGREELLGFGLDLGRSVSVLLRLRLRGLVGSSRTLGGVEDRGEVTVETRGLDRGVDGVLRGGLAGALALLAFAGGDG